MTENHSLAVVAGAIPAGVVCLPTALQFHDVGTQLPREVWLAVPRGTRVGALRNPPVRVVNIARALVDVGVERHKLEGQLVRVTSIARTVADCFRFRNQIGLDVAMEALAELRIQHRGRPYRVL